MGKGTKGEKKKGVPAEEALGKGENKKENAPSEESVVEPEIVIDIEGEENAAALEARLDKLASENVELLEGLKRLKADFENYRKRMVREQTRILETAEAGIIKKIMPVIDNLERAVKNSSEDDDAEGVRQGVLMVLDQMLQILKKEGLEVVDPEGQPFNPEYHEAMMVVESDQCPQDTVIEVAQKGYLFKGMLLRPAMVKVSCPVNDHG